MTLPRKSGRARPWSPSRAGWRPRRGNPSGPRPARPDQAAHRRLRRRDRVLLPVGVSHHHPLGPRAPHRHHRSCARSIADARRASCPALVTVVAVTTVVLLIDRQRPQCRAGPRTRRRGSHLHDQPLRLDRPRLRHLGLLQLHLVALGRGAVLPAVAVRAALGLSPQPSAVRRAHRGAHRGHPGARPLPRPEPSGEVRPARVLRERHQCAAHPGRLACSRSSCTTAGCRGRFGTWRPVRCWPSPSCPSWRIGTTPIAPPW